MKSISKKYIYLQIKVHRMALVTLKVAGFENQQQGYLVLEEPIQAAAIDPEVTRKIETLHFILDGGGKTLQDGSHAFGFSYQGGQILAATAFSEEPGPAAVVEVVSHGVLPMPGSRAEANLAEWDTSMAAKSITEVRQVSTQCKATRIDCWIVVQSAGIR